MALSVHCCCDVVSYAIRTKSKRRKSAGVLTLTSDRQQQRSSIMMHPSGHPAARQQRCSNAPIPSRQPRSPCTSTWSTLCVVTYRQPPCVLRSSESKTLSALCLRAKSAQYCWAREIEFMNPYDTATPCVFKHRQTPCVLRSNSDPTCSVAACAGVFS